MKRFNFSRIFSLALALFLCLGAFPPADSALAEAPYQLGDAIEDFTVTTYDGKTVTLSEVLKEKEVVLINIWASWCDPCRYEFPYMQEAYSRYSDKVEIIAISREPTDTDDVLADFAEELGLTFPIAQDTVNMTRKLSASSIPTTAIVDRFGNLCFWDSGAFPSTEAFCQLFEAFIGDDYTESTLYTALPPALPNIAPVSEADLSAALNAEGGTIAFTNDPGKYSWPMLVGEKDGRSVAISSNTGHDSSKALVNASVSAKAGDALVVSFKISGEVGADLMRLIIDGKTVKSFGGEKDWMTYAHPISADGEYSVSLAYTKDDIGSVSEDTLWIDSLSVLSGEEAARALAANPVYPVSKETTISILNESAREIVFDDPTGNIAARYGSIAYYIIPDDSIRFVPMLSDEYDAETAFCYLNYDRSTHPLMNCIDNDRYLFTGGGDSSKTTGYVDSTVFLYPDYSNLAEAKPILSVTYFKNEEDVDRFVSQITADKNGIIQGSWKYADEADEPAEARSASTAAEAVYTVQYVDQNGEPVVGVMLQVCNDDTCLVFASDKNGICEFTLAPYAWELHTLLIPEGYEGDTETITTAPVTGGEIVFTLNKL